MRRKKERGRSRDGEIGSCVESQNNCCWRQLLLEGKSGNILGCVSLVDVRSMMANFRTVGKGKGRSRLMIALA